jgi:hypothetical protein
MFKDAIIVKSDEGRGITKKGLSISIELQILIND